MTLDENGLREPTYKEIVIVPIMWIVLGVFLHIIGWWYV